MRYPWFIAEMGAPERRHNLWSGVWSGYVTVIAFSVLILIAQLLDVIPWGWPFWALIGLKFASNTLNWVGLRLDRLALTSTVFNLFIDIVVMTGAIYLTGGVTSPLAPIYLIEITVIALLTNLYCTLATTVVIVISYTTMCVLSYVGALPAWPNPAGMPYDITAGYLITHLVGSTLVFSMPTVFTVLILRSLANKEKMLEQRTRELETVQAHKAQFIASIAHDLRSPLFGIQGMCELLQDGDYGELSDEQADAAQTIADTAVDLITLADDLLQLTHTETTKPSYSPSRVDPHELVPRVMASVKGMLVNKPLSLDYDVAEDVPVIVTDRGKLNQILINLLANAIKFTAERGRVSTRVRRAHGGRVAFAIADTGVGIASDELDRIFEPYEQVGDDGKSGYGGVGLGLAVVDQLVALLGGTIEVESNAGVGSTFRVYLPQVGPSEPVEQSPQTA